MTDVKRSLNGLEISSFRPQCSKGTPFEEKSFKPDFNNPVQRSFYFAALQSEMTFFLESVIKYFLKPETLI